MRAAALYLFLMVVGGCAVSKMDVATLQSEGYQKIVFLRAEDGSENPNYALWVKEISDPGRKVEVCLVPNVAVEEYFWRVVVIIDGKEAWHHDDRVYPQFSGPRPIDCVTSRILPSGKLTYKADFQYKPLGGTPQVKPAERQPGPIPTPGSSTDKPPGSISPDIESRLRRLQDLRDKKLITEEEYQAHRKELLKELLK